jgi:ABC-type dipeptide/oligopeptide/nickel transport system ATPase subunit
MLYSPCSAMIFQHMKNSFKTQPTITKSLQISLAIVTNNQKKMQPLF